MDVAYLSEQDFYGDRTQNPNGRLLVVPHEGAQRHLLVRRCLGAALALAVTVGCTAGALVADGWAGVFVVSWGIALVATLMVVVRFYLTPWIPTKRYVEVFTFRSDVGSATTNLGAAVGRFNRAYPKARALFDTAPLESMVRTLARQSGAAGCSAPPSENQTPPVRHPQNAAVSTTLIDQRPTVAEASMNLIVSSGETITALATNLGELCYLSSEGFIDSTVSFKAPPRSSLPQAAGAWIEWMRSYHPGGLIVQTEVAK